MQEDTLSKKLLLRGLKKETLALLFNSEFSLEKVIAALNEIAENMSIVMKKLQEKNPKTKLEDLSKLLNTSFGKLEAKKLYEEAEKELEKSAKK